MSKEELEELCYQLYMVGNTDALKGIIRGRDQVMVIFNERLKTLTKTKTKKMEEQIIKLLRENSLGKQTAVIESMNLGVYIWRKRLQVIKDFMDVEFSDLSEDEQKLVLSNVENNQYSKSKSYQG